MQGKTDGELLSWLAGFMDGEGSFVIIKSGGRIQPRVQVNNTHYPTLSWLTEKLTVLGLPHYVGTKKGGLHKHDPYNRKQQWVIMVAGFKRSIRWCQALLPYLVTKRRQAELLLEFCHSRLSNENDWKKKKIILPREAEIMEQLRSANH